jgi:hypothetical protein
MDMKIDKDTDFRGVEKKPSLGRHDTQFVKLHPEVRTNNKS